MDHLHSTTKPPVKGSHLSFEERVIIQTRLKDGWSANRISVELHRSPNTIRNEIKRGTAALYNGTVFRYKAEAGQQAYEQNRTGCCRHYALLEKESFIRYVEAHFFEDGWSLDSCVANADKGNEFHKEDIVCTKTLYNYVDSGLLKIKNIDLPEKPDRKTKKTRIHKNKRVLGRSIEERPADIEARKEFEHWEVDLILGSKKGSDSAILSLLERKTRRYLMIRVPRLNPDGVMAAILNLKEQYKEHWNDIFKTMTTDNGSELSKLSNLEKLSKTLVYCPSLCTL